MSEEIPEQVSLQPVELVGELPDDQEFSGLQMQKNVVL